MLRLNTCCSCLTDFLLCNQYTLNTHLEIGSDYQLNMEEWLSIITRQRVMSHCLQAVQAFALYTQSEREAGRGQNMSNPERKGWTIS